MVIRNFLDIDRLLFCLDELKEQKIEFSSNQLKSNFLNRLPKSFTIINCNSSTTRFEKDLENACGTIIFNNLNKCMEEDIRKIVTNSKEIIIY